MSIATEISRLQSAKADIKTAIEGKGVSVPSSALLDDYADYIELIQGGDGWTTDGIAQNLEPSGDVVLGSEVTSIGQRAFANKPITSISGEKVTSLGLQALLGSRIASVNFPNVTTGENGVMAYTPLVSVSLPKLTILPDVFFQQCKSLESVDLPNVTRIGTSGSNTGSTFDGCSELTTLILPKFQSKVTSAANTFKGSSIVTLVLPSVTSLGMNGFVSSKVKTIDFGETYSAFTGNCLNGGAYIETIILRKKNGVVSLHATGNLQQTCFKSGGTGGTLYVPNDLIASYQSATNWTTYLGYATNQILPIEGTIYETQYADGTPIE